MIKDNRYAKRENKIIDLLAKPYTLELIRKRYLGNGFTLQELSEDYLYRIKRGTLQLRIFRLCKNGWLNKNQINNAGKIYKYSFSERSKDYLKKYGTFTNDMGILMNPSSILKQRMWEDLQKKEKDFKNTK